MAKEGVEKVSPEGGEEGLSDRDILGLLKRSPVTARVDPAVARNLNFAASLGEGIAFLDALVEYQNEEGETYPQWIDDAAAVEVCVSSVIGGESYPSIAKQVVVRGTAMAITLFTKRKRVRFQNVGLSSLPIAPGDFGLVFVNAW